MSGFDQAQRKGDEAGASPDAAATPGKQTLTEALPRSSGAPLPGGLGNALGASLGADLGGVRVHDGAESAASAASVGARAYTVGQDIHFGAGQYQPSTTAGQELIAHETAHTVQQRGAAAPAAQAKLEVSQPGDAHEVEADRFASAFIASGDVAPVSPVSPVSAGVVSRQAIQRDPDPNAQQGQGQQVAGPAWTVPADLVPDIVSSQGPAHTKEEVFYFLAVARDKVGDLPVKFHMKDRTHVDSILKGIDGQMATYRGASGALTSHDVADMSGFAFLLAASWKNVIQGLSTDLQTKVATLDQHHPSTENIDGIEADLAEELHNQFNEGHEGKIEQISEAMHHVNQYKERVELVTPWIKGAVSLVASAHTVEKLEKFAERGEELSKGLAIARGVVEAAQLLNHALSHDGASGAQGDITAFSNAVNAIDIGMTFAEAVPVLGQLWAFYYGPLTRKCIDLLRVIAKHEDKEARDLTLVEWMTHPRPDEVTPRIPRELESYFPGGQPVLNVMYPLVNGRTYAVGPAAEQFFLSKRGLFNAGAEGKMESKSNKELFHPSTWGDDASSPNLFGWLWNNKDRVWAMLYGDMPHTLR